MTRKTLGPRSAYSIFDLFGLFFQPEQYFSLTAIQPEQCFSASFSQNLASRMGPWWWNKDVQKAIKKKECYKCLYHGRCTDNIEKYKVTKKTAKRAVSEVNGRAYEDLY